MSVKIRLARGGAKKRPYYRIVVADTRSPRDGRFIERIGSYDPMLVKDHPDRVKIDVDRAKHWLSVGATPSDRVSRFLAKLDLVPARHVPTQTKKDQPKAKAVERMKEAEEAKKAAAEAPAPEPEAPAAEEAPAEEAPAAEAAAEAPAEEAPAAEADPEKAPEEAKA